MPDKEKDSILRLKHSQLVASPENRPCRSGMDDKSIGELAQSIAAQGIIEPLTVRSDRESGQYEIVCGERRWTAYGVAIKKFGVKDGLIPAIFRELTDSQVREIRLIENVQREGINEIEEAAGYQELLDMKDEMNRAVHTIQDLAKKLGKSQAFIYGRLKLLAMPDIAQNAMLKGKLNASVALLISRIPDPKVARKATLEVLEQYGRNHDEKVALDPETEPMSYREAKRHIQTNFMIRLKGAPFDQEDENLVPIYNNAEGHREGGGACSKCPFRTGNMKAQGVEADSADVCTNTTCFKRKKDTAWRNEKAKAAEKNQDLLTENQSRRLLNWVGTALSDEARCNWVDIRETIPGKKVTWEEALEDHLAEDTVVTLARGKKNHLLLPVAVVAEAAKKAKIKFEAPKPSSNGHDAEAWQREQKERDARKAEAFRIVEEAFNQIMAQAGTQTNSVPFLRLLASQVCRGKYLNPREFKNDKAIAKHFAELDGESVWKAIIEGVWFNDPVNYQGVIHPDFDEFCKLYSVDLKDIATNLAAKPGQKDDK